MEREEYVVPFAGSRPEKLRPFASLTKDGIWYMDTRAKPGPGSSVSDFSTDSMLNEALPHTPGFNGIANQAANDVLLIEDDPVFATRILKVFADVEAGSFRVNWTNRIDGAREHLRKQSTEVVLLALTLANYQSLDTLDEITRLAPDALVLVLCDSLYEETALLAVRRGAYDYLVKDQMDIALWPRLLRYIVTSWRAKDALDKSEAREFILRAAEDALFVERQRALVTLNSIDDAVLTIDLKGNVTYLNGTAESMTGWSHEEALGQPLTKVFSIVDASTNQIVPNPAQLAIEEDRNVALATDCVLVRRDGSESSIEDSAAPIHNRDGDVAGAVIVFRDISHARLTTAKMAHFAQHDFLTGLPNRVLLTERMRQSIGLAHRHGSQVALMFVDLDFFKHINDSLGHAIGDKLLQSAAQRLTACVRASDTVCRLGGDEFVILLAEIEQSRDAAHVAEKLLAAFRAPHWICEHELNLTLSIGISIFPDDGVEADLVMQNADTAMYHAKTSGRNNYQFFHPEMNVRVEQRILLIKKLQHALKGGEFLLHYQPKIDLASGTIMGVEALVRWQDPSRGLQYPAQFLPLAEESGLIVPIGRWVLREACSQAQAWLRQGLCAVPIAVNISALEFQQKGFLGDIALVLHETELEPGYLELELSEGVLMHDAEASIVKLDALKELGVRLTINDFGVGYSNLSYLKRFAIDTLKIDRSFVGSVDDADKAVIVGAMIDMAKNLSLKVTAAGVERQDQLSFLRARRCNNGQGFAICGPLRASDFSLLLNR